MPGLRLSYLRQPKCSLLRLEEKQMPRITHKSPGRLEFDCGCIFITSGKTSVLDPCRPSASCEVSIFVQREAMAQGKLKLVARRGSI